jgi:Zn-dependent protease
MEGWIEQPPTEAPDAFIAPRAPDAFAAPTRRTRLRERLAGLGAAIAALAAKLKSVILLLPKLKLLTASGTALVSVAAYSLFWGWQFAAGFVVLLFVHEMGHVIQLRREGIKASAPTFIPFLGAVISARSLGDDALAEARVGLAGPILGSLGAAVVAAVGALTGSDLLLALAFVGFFLNLFNLLPVVPLDGGRAMAAMAPWMWFAGLGGLFVLWLLRPNPILLLIMLFAAFDLSRRWRHRNSRTIEAAAYYRVPTRSRLLVAAVYIGLIVALVLGMDATQVLQSGGHSFVSI